MTKRPNIVLIMPDDMGWGQLSLRDHPHLNTPNLDAMAANGMLMDRFYSSGPQCSPTRAATLTGRAGDRSGVHFHGYRMDLREKTIAKALRDVGYRTGFFGKWHVNGLRGQFGAPMLTTDSHNATVFGFQEWTANINNIAYQGLVGDHEGNIIEIPGTSSDAIASYTNSFIENASSAENPFFAVVWLSAPHAPFFAEAADKVGFESLSADLQNHFGMIVELDRAVGSIRQKLRDLSIENNTLLWFFGDNGGYDWVDPDANGALRDGKNSLYEGGIRVPSIVEWPGGVPAASVSKQLAYTSDVARTLASIGGTTDEALLCPQDGKDISCSLYGVSDVPNRGLPFHSLDGAALVSDHWKIVTEDIRGSVTWELYNLSSDPQESVNVAADNPDIVDALAKAYFEWYGSVRGSVNGYDYFDRNAGDYPFSGFWPNDPLYASHLTSWQNRPEYAVTFAESAQPPGEHFDEKYGF